jgi:hypothetical protein
MAANGTAPAVADGNGDNHHTADRHHGSRTVAVVGRGVLAATLIELPGGRVYCIVQPPSTANATPVIKEDSSEQSHTTACAISSGSPIRPRGALLAR